MLHNIYIRLTFDDVVHSQRDKTHHPITKYAVTLNHLFWPHHNQDLIHYLGPRINYMNLHLLDDGVSPDDGDGFDDFHNDSQAFERRFSYVTSTHKMVLHLVFLPHLAQIGRTQQKCW